MFQSLRVNSPFYILHKDSKPYIEMGSVVSVSLPIPKFMVPQTFGLPLEMVVDIAVRVNGQIINFLKLPANQDLADTNQFVVVSASRDAMNSEVASLKLKSIDIINSIDNHRDIISGCDIILLDLNPEYAEKLRLQIEINSLKELMRTMSQNMADLMTMNKELMGKLSGNLNKTE